MVVRSHAAPPPVVKPFDSHAVAVPGTTGVTLAEFRQMRDVGLPTELIRGEIVALPRPVDRHALYCGNVVEVLQEWSPRRSKGFVLPNDAGLVTEEEPDSLRGPDVIFLSRERAPADFPSGD